MRFILLAFLLISFAANAQVKPFGNINAGYETGKYVSGFAGNASAGVKFNNLFYVGAGAGYVNHATWSKFYPIFAKFAVVDSKKTGLLLSFEPGIISNSMRLTNENGNDMGTSRSNGFYYNASAGIKLLKSKKVSPVVTAGYSSYNIDGAIGKYNAGFFSAKVGVLF